MSDFLQKINKLKQKPVLTNSVGCLFMFALSFFFIYRVRVINAPKYIAGMRGQIIYTLGVFAFAMLFVLIFRAAKKRSGENLPLFMSALVFALGVLFSFATPINQVPDENTHFLRGVQMAYGDWGFEEGYVFPDDVNLLMQCFPVAYNNGYPAKDTGIVYDRYSQYYELRRQGTEKAENNGIIIFQVLPYIPLTVGIFAARILGMSAMAMYFMGRIRNVCFFTLCAYFALKMSGRFKMILFSIMCLPLMCFMYGSCNSDAVLFGLMFLMFGAVLSDEFDKYKFFTFALTLALLATCKMTYIVFLPMLLCIKNENWNVKVRGKSINKLTALIVTVLIFVVVYEGTSLYVAAFSNFGTIDRTMADTDPMRQLLFIVKNPLRYAAVFADTLKNNSFFLFSGGLLGWIDVKIPLVNYLTPLIALFTVVNGAGVFEKRDAVKTAGFFVCSLLTYATAMTGLYLSWTPVTLPQIIGMQARYVYPAFLGFAMVVGQYFAGKIKPDTDNSSVGCIGVQYAFCVVAAVMMIMVYSLPERAAVFIA